MKNIIITIFCLGLFNSLFAQNTINLTGDPNDSSFMALVKKMEKGGNEVTINKIPDVELKNLDQDLTIFSMLDLSGDTLKSADLLGKKVHINFWSISCKFCIQEFPELNKLKKMYEDQGYVFISIAPDSPKKIRKVLAKHPLEWRVVPDAALYIEKVSVKSFPNNFFVDESGVVKAIESGASFDLKIVKGKEKMVPDNFDRLEEALLSL